MPSQSGFGGARRGRDPVTVHAASTPARRHRAGTRQADRLDHRRAARGDAGVRGDKLVEAIADYGKYPPIRGTEELRSAIAAWAGRRYGAAAAPDPTTRGVAAQRLARGAVSRGISCRGPQEGRRPPRRAHVQSLLQRLHRRRARGQRRAGLSQCHRGDGPPARPRSDRLRQGAARPHGRALPVLAREPAGCRRQPGLHRPRARARARPRLHAVLRRVLLGNLCWRATAGRARRRRGDV